MYLINAEVLGYITQVNYDLWKVAEVIGLGIEGFEMDENECG